VDGKLHPEHTPTVLHLEREREYQLVLRGPSGTLSKRIKNQKKLSVQLSAPLAGELEDEVWDAPPWRRPGQAAEKTATALAAAAAPDIAAPTAHTEPTPEPARFDAESAPVALQLTAEHEVLVPEKLCLAARKGTWRLLLAPNVFAVAYAGGRNQSAAARRAPTRPSLQTRTLTLLYLDKMLGRVDLFPRHLESREAATLCPFSLSDRSLEALSEMAPPTIQLGTRDALKLPGSLVTVPLDARFLVRSLPRGKRWQAHVSPVQPPFAVMIARRTDGPEEVTVLDQPTVDIPEAGSVWFTVPVLQRADLKVDVTISER
jgi:hypothetical protein